MLPGCSQRSEVGLLLYIDLLPGCSQRSDVGLRGYIEHLL